MEFVTADFNQTIVNAQHLRRRFAAIDTANDVTTTRMNMSDFELYREYLHRGHHS